jgi:hypothetical protein
MGRSGRYFCSGSIAEGSAVGTRGWAGGWAAVLTADFGGSMGSEAKDSSREAREFLAGSEKTEGRADVWYAEVWLDAMLGRIPDRLS